MKFTLIKLRLNIASILMMTCALTACSNESTIAATHNADITNGTELPVTTSYHGTASVTQGEATVDIPSLYDCQNGRSSPVGHIKSTDGKTWTVPADVRFTDTNFPFASDLNNPCTGVAYASASEALDALDSSDIIEIDADGDVITAYVFTDNYFEMYVNGIPVGKDNVPFTQFNSNILQFQVTKPFTVAMKLVDWEENSGIGSEQNRNNAYHAGDGGMVAVFKDANNHIIAKTDENWTAQTFYSAPIRDLSCAIEQGTLRLTTECSTEARDDGSQAYALHWELPRYWYIEEFDDSAWPNATVFTNDDIGVNNKSAYTDFVDIFDSPEDDARFIWSSNVILDNEVIVRHTVN
ncbi:MAG: hypothetical protein ACTHYG_05390 [Psychrobacter sp.]